MDKAEIDYLGLMNYLENNREIPYTKPENPSIDDRERKRVLEVKEKGQRAAAQMNRMADICQEKFKLYSIGSTSWLDGSKTKTKKYLWTKLKYKEFKDRPESISLFVDMSEKTNHARFRFSIEIKNEDSDKAKMDNYHRHLEVPLQEDSTIVYVSGSNKFGDPIVVNEDQETIKKKVNSGEYTKIQPCRLVEWNEDLTNDDVEKAMLTGVRELIPLYKHILGITEYDTSTEEDEVKNKGDDDIVSGFTYDKNMILYGPPGTGKTYNTAIYAVAICDGLKLEDVKNKPYDEVLKRYRILKDKENRIAFTTFHQSYGYEEFIEGIKPRLDPDSTGIEYTIIDGVFKEFCDRASQKIINTNLSEISEEATIWKVTVRSKVKNDCFDNNRVRINWGIDTEGAKGFVDEMANGDIILTTDGSRKNINGIAVVSSEDAYEFADESDKTTRNVKWLAKNIDCDITDINDKKMLHRMTVARVPNMNLSDIISLAKKYNAELDKTIIFDNTKPYVFIIDEINRGNISKIFGELITLIEPTKRKGSDEGMEAILPYSNSTFGVPINVYLIGTMNTADRSIALMDTALRRRFQFEEMMPDSQILRELVADKVTDGDLELDVANMLDVINRRIEYLFDREHTIGHAFFTGLKDGASVSKLASIFKKSVIPLLQEYFYEDYGKIRMILGDNGKNNIENMFITAKEIKANHIFRGDTSDIDIPEYAYEIQDKAFYNLKSYIEII
jgi:putative mcrBC restriction endonuclease system, mcrB subunit